MGNPAPRRKSARMSRPARWADAMGRAEEAASALREAVTELQELQEEYNDWFDSMPENLQDGPTGEKLQAILELELEPDTVAPQDIDNATDVELPLGFGRD